MKFIRMKSSHNGERMYVAQEIRRTKKETQGQQANADIRRNIRIAMYRKRFEEGQDLMTGKPVPPEDRDDIVYINEMRRRSKNE